jgi:hypothetical protein
MRDEGRPLAVAVQTGAANYLEAAPKKSANKGQPAEWAEGRAAANGKALEPNVCRTQSRESTLNGLERLGKTGSLRGRRNMNPNDTLQFAKPVNISQRNLQFHKGARKAPLQLWITHALREPPHMALRV